MRKKPILVWTEVQWREERFDSLEGMEMGSCKRKLGKIMINE